MEQIYKDQNSLCVQNNIKQLQHHVKEVVTCFLHLNVLIWAITRKAVLKKFVKFTVKHLCQGLFFNKLAGLRPETLLKKSLWHRCFPVNCVNFLRTFFLQSTLGRLKTSFKEYHISVLVTHIWTPEFSLREIRNYN